MMITPKQFVAALVAQDDKRHGIDQAYFSREPSDADMRDFLFDGRIDIVALCDELNAMNKKPVYALSFSGPEQAAIARRIKDTNGRAPYDVLSDAAMAIEFAREMQAVPLEVITAIQAVLVYAEKIYDMRPPPSGLR